MSAGSSRSTRDCTSATSNCPRGYAWGAHVDLDEMIAKVAPLRVVVEEEVAAPVEAAPAAAIDATGKTETPPEA